MIVGWVAQNQEPARFRRLTAYLAFEIGDNKSPISAVHQRNLAGGRGGQRMRNERDQFCQWTLIFGREFGIALGSKQHQPANGDTALSRDRVQASVASLVKRRKTLL
ncbi:hypothetical protein [Nitrococcus mobilis]|uniref:hypothetical protein n=1 Tax=Nitrococcus mobilis TaxID=35797 RepID=UPI0012EA8D4F|nr:hypothetical protein [Nitrococcus mobilis]